MEELAEAQKRTEARVDELARRMDELAKQMSELAAAQAEMLREQRLMRQQLGSLSKDMAGVKGIVLELRYRTRAHAYFGTRYRNLRVIEPSNLDKVEQAYEAGQFTECEWRNLNKIDVLMRGTTGVGPSKREELLALEVLWIIDASDIERANERADILRRLGYPVQAAVGGHDILESAKNRAKELNVLVALDGTLDKDEGEASN